MCIRDSFKAMDREQFVDKLLQVDTDEGTAAWASFFLDPEKVRLLTEIMSPHQAGEVFYAREHAMTAVAGTQDVQASVCGT